MKVLIDSKYRESGTLTNYKYILPHPVKNVREVRLLQSVIPNSIYQLASGYNTFDFTEDPAGTPDAQTITLTPGNYTGSELATEIETQLNADMTGNDYSVSYDSNTNKLTTTKTSGTWKYDSGNGEEIIRILGIPSTGSGNQTTDYEHDNQIDLSYPRYILVDLTTGATNTNDVMTNNGAHSFVLNLGGDPYVLEKTSSLADYLQIENNNNNDVRHIDVQIKLPGFVVSPDFHGIDHQLLIELL